jgi:CRP-like cAMP-binding protein
MVSKDELRQIKIMSALSDETLEKLAPHARRRVFREHQIIYRQGEEAAQLYMLSRGKIVLEARLSQRVTVTLGSIKPGYSFGWSSILGGGAYTSSAVAVQDSEVFSLSGRILKEHMDEDHTMGFILMRETAMILKNRLERRTSQFLKLLMEHPELRKILEH